MELQRRGFKSARQINGTNYVLLRAIAHELLVYRPETFVRASLTLCSDYRGLCNSLINEWVFADARIVGSNAATKLLECINMFSNVAGQFEREDKRENREQMASRLFNISLEQAALFLEGFKFALFGKFSTDFIEPSFT